MPPLYLNRYWILIEESENCLKDIIRDVCRETLLNREITYLRMLWINDPRLSAYEVARRAGLSNEKALYQFPNPNWVWIEGNGGEISGKTF